MGKGSSYGIVFASGHARESTLSTLHAFASSRHRFERKRIKKPKTKS